jgi:predicted CXXCH cytochrome family protein
VREVNSGARLRGQVRRDMHRRSWVVALAGAIAVAGCGGGAKPGSTAGQKGSSQVTFTVTVNNQGPGTVTSSPAGIDCPAATTCSAQFSWNTPVLLRAQPGSQQYFNGWFGECSGTADCALAGNADKYVVSYFSAKPEAHANFTSPAQHGPAYADFLARAPTALDCTACHGASLQGQGLAPACASCHDAGSLLRLKRPAGPVAGAVAGGLEGYVRDVTGAPVASATVYLVKSTDIKDPTVAANFINKNGNDSLLGNASDEPLEGAIAAGGVTSAVTDGAGYYRFDPFPADEPYPYNGRFITVVPALLDDAHLPGGSACRAPYRYAALAGKRLDILVSMKPSATAAFVGPSRCLSCHTGHANQLQTAHANSLKPIGAAAPNRFPNWFEARNLFTDAGTALNLVWMPDPYNEAAVYTTDQSANPNLIHTARLYKAGTDYFIELKKVSSGTATPWPGDGLSGPGVYKVELAYGGGLYKQRFITKIGTSRYIIPLQYNFESQSGETAAGEFTRFKWQQYNLGQWNASALTGGTPATPPAARSFDHQCAGCHFTGYKLDLAANAASAVADPNGEAAFSGTAPETLNVTCETCHGPGSEHVAGGRAMVSVSLLTPEREVTICAQCHTRFNGKDLGTVGMNNYTSAKSEAGLALTDDKTHAATMVAGTSRSAFVANYVSVAGDALWKMDGTAGNYVLAPQFSHQKEPYKHHQQASDFIKTKKYRNPYELLTCTACHDIHGDTAQPHQLKNVLDDAGFGGGEGLCLGCHKAYLSVGQAIVTPETPIAERMKAHWVSQGINAVWMDGIRCTDCHMPKTAKSGSGTPSLTIAGTVYYENDIASHLLQVPRAADIVRTGGVPANQPGITATPSLIPIPYTNACGSCHAYSPKSGW